MNDAAQSYGKKLSVRTRFWSGLNFDQRRQMYVLEGRYLIQEMGYPASVCGVALEPLHRWVAGEVVDLLPFLKRMEEVFHDHLPEHVRDPFGGGVFKNITLDALKDLLVLGSVITDLDGVWARLQDDWWVSRAICDNELLYVAAVVHDDPFQALSLSESVDQPWRLIEAAKMFQPAFTETPECLQWLKNHPLKTRTKPHPRIFSHSWVEDRYLHEHTALCITTYALVFHLKDCGLSWNVGEPDGSGIT